MREIRRILPVFALMVPIGCADAALEPLAPGTAGHAAVAGPTEVAGSYDAIVDFETLRLTPVGENCRLVVDGALVFSGSIEGTATGTTTALVFTPCDELGPPGTFRDVFTSELRFEGTVNGEPAEADGLYQGITEIGGGIDGRIIFSNGVAGELEVDARVAVGGSYEGSVVVR